MKLIKQGKYYKIVLEDKGEFKGRYTVYGANNISPLESETPDYPLYSYATEKAALKRLAALGESI